MVVPRQGDDAVPSVRDTIDDARADGVPWVVVGMHYPCLSIGVYGCGVGTDLMNLLVEKRVDLVLSGHEHGYQRTKQCSRAGLQHVPTATTDTDCIVDAGDSMVAGRGTVFATVGTGGVGLQTSSVSSQVDYFKRWSGSNARPRIRLPRCGCIRTR